MKTKKIVKAALLFVLIIIIAAVLVLFIWLNSTKPVTSGKFTVKMGRIGSEIKIERNRWGVPSINAGNLKDLFWGVGFVHASDRLFQMDLIRRLSNGRLSEVLGKRTLETDKYHKDHLIEESVERAYQNMKPEIKKIMNSYCDGVNYYIENESLQPEFKLLGYTPEKWTIRDSLSVLKRMEMILASSGSELSNFRLAFLLGRKRAESLVTGKNPSTIISPQELEFSNPSGFLDHELTWEIEYMNGSIGSNNWVISGTKTKSGKPILCNDPHLPSVFPSNFYQVYATAGETILSGNTIPGIPFIIIGRNSKIGWGFTNIGTDVIDYFILKTDPNNNSRYLFENEWKEFTEIKKEIRVKGEKSVIHKVKMSAFGPVFEVDGKMIARHSIALYPSNVMEAVFGMNLAQNIDDFILSIKKFTAPAQNVVFADVLGNIGYFPSGSVPVRAKGNGLFPVTARGAKDIWSGFWDSEKKQYLINPKKGFIATANNRVLPEGELPVFSEEWFPSFRAERITKLLTSAKKLTVEDNMKFQLDTYLPGAKFLIDRIRKMNFYSKEAKYVSSQLFNWDFKADGGIGPVLFYRFEYYLARNLFIDEFKETKDHKLISRHWIYKILNYPAGGPDKKVLEEWADVKGTPQKETFSQIVELSLRNTFNEFNTRGGEEKMRWENVHTLFYKHPLGSVFPLKYFLNRGPFPVSGGNDCIMITSFRNRADFNTVHLSAFRMVMDFNDFSNSKLINSSGQSGHFLSDFYDDQIKLFVDAKYRIMENFKKSDETIIFKPE